MNAKSFKTSYEGRSKYYLNMKANQTISSSSLIKMICNMIFQEPLYKMNVTLINYKSLHFRSIIEMFYILHELTMTSVSSIPHSECLIKILCRLYYINLLIAIRIEHLMKYKLKHASNPGLYKAKI